ncbi:MAG: helix-turn-helix transcriptional regulator [Chitinophagales bacterium]
MVAYPILKKTLKALKPKPVAYPTKITTIGDHIRKKRLDLGLYQKDVAQFIGVTTDTITFWEKGRSKPTIKQMPKIITFLGYNPCIKEAKTIGEKLYQYRIENGVTVKELIKLIKIDRQTILKIEGGETVSVKAFNKMAGFLNDNKKNK